MGKNQELWYEFKVCKGGKIFFVPFKTFGFLRVMVANWHMYDMWFLNLFEFYEILDSFGQFGHIPIKNV